MRIITEVFDLTESTTIPIEICLYPEGARITRDSMRNLVMVCDNDSFYEYSVNVYRASGEGDDLQPLLDNATKLFNLYMLRTVEGNKIKVYTRSSDKKQIAF